MKIIRIFITLVLFFFYILANANDSAFKKWLIDFKIYALKQKITEATFDAVMTDVKFLPKVIKYDRFQPEFYEDT